jgi:hypothetical protein
MKIFLTEKQLKYLKSNLISESDEVNQYGFTQDEMKRIEEFVRNNVKQQYEWLKKEVEDGEEYAEMLEKIKSHIKNNPDIPEKYFDYMVKEYEAKVKQHEKNKKNLENFDFEEYVKDGIDRDIHGGAYTMSYRIRYDKWEKEQLNRKLTKEDITDILVTALEGGSNYWYLIDLPENIKSYGQSTSEAVGEYILRGGSIDFYDKEEYYDVRRALKDGDYNIGDSDDMVDEKSYKEDIENTKLGHIDMNRILEAITKIKSEYPEVWKNILLENADAGDADVFLQLCVMGEVVYG